LVLVIFGLPTALTAQGNSAEHCAKALIQDVGYLDMNESLSIARFDLFSRSVARDTKKMFGITVPIYGVPLSAEYEAAEKLRERYFQNSQLDWHYNRSISVATQTLSQNAVEAYRACIDGAHRSGPRITVYDAKPTEMTVTIRWLSPAVAPTTTDDVEVLVVGGSTNFTFPSSLTTGSTFGFVITREADQDVRIVANIASDNDNIFVSAFPPAPRFPTHYKVAYDSSLGLKAGSGKMPVISGTLSVFGPKSNNCGQNDLSNCQTDENGMLSSFMVRNCDEKRGNSASSPLVASEAVVDDNQNRMVCKIVGTYFSNGDFEEH
jgi:hypothetical protein